MALSPFAPPPRALPTISQCRRALVQAYGLASQVRLVETTQPTGALVSVVQDGSVRVLVRVIHPEAYYEATVSALRLHARGRAS